MFPYSDLHGALRRFAVDAALFDSYRLVDVETHRVYAYTDDDGAPTRTNDLCHWIWRRDKPCANCTSRACLDRREQVIKIEQLEDKVLLINSLPVAVDGRAFALELVKDVTSSLMVADGVMRDNIEITQMINRFNDLAVRDTFTMLYNKTFINNELESLTASAPDHLEDGMRPAALIALDVNSFKEVNDTYGHDMGDDVLQYVAQRFKRTARALEGAWAGRSGGDEFLICAPNGLSEDELIRFRSMIHDVREHRFEDGGRSFSVTVSYGIAFLEPGDTPRDFLRRADEAMYTMKRTHHQERKTAE